MEYDQYTVPDDCSCQTYFSLFPLALANMASLVLFFQISLKNSELKTTHKYLSGLSRAFFRTTFLEIAVIRRCLKIPSGGTNYNSVFGDSCGGNNKTWKCLPTFIKF